MNKSTYGRFMSGDGDLEAFNDHGSDAMRQFKAYIMSPSYLSYHLMAAPNPGLCCVVASLKIDGFVV